jgi:hypothetical protein
MAVGDGQLGKIIIDAGQAWRNRGHFLLQEPDRFQIKDMGMRIYGQRGHGISSLQEGRISVSRIRS